MRAFLLKSDGSQSQVKPTNGTDFTLEELQGFVGGYIEVVRSALDGMILIVDEEGKLKGKPVNETATRFMHKQFSGIDCVAGDALCTPAEWVK